MELGAKILSGVVALLHIGFMVLESFLWATPTGRRIFGMTAEMAESTKALAQNQGLYNGFLAAGLIWSLVHPDPAIGHQLRLFFLGCVIVAGIVGAATAKVTILFIQALPAALALILCVLAARASAG